MIKIFISITKIALSAGIGYVIGYYVIGVAIKKYQSFNKTKDVEKKVSFSEKEN